MNPGVLRTLVVILSLVFLAGLVLMAQGFLHDCSPQSRKKPLPAWYRLLVAAVVLATLFALHFVAGTPIYVPTGAPLPWVER